MALDEAEITARLRTEWLPAWRKERERLDVIDRWYRWDHDKPHSPRTATPEYKQLGNRSQTPWGGLVVTDVAQNLYVDGYRRSKDTAEAPAWQWWQENGMDARQIAIHRASLAYGLAYATVVQGETFMGDRIPVIRGRSPRRMIAFYREPAYDDWPEVAVQVDPVKDAYTIRVYDDSNVHLLTAEKGGAKVAYARDLGRHGANVCPVVRYANMLDLEGRADGEVEPFIAVFGRIDQTVFDRLVVQRFASWVVRTISGMSRSDTVEATGETPEQVKLRLKVEDLLVAENPETKFGSLPASDLAGFIAAKESDVRDLAAVTQTPPHHLLGSMVNVSAEGLAAAEAALMRKVTERKYAFGESHEQAIRLSAAVMGDAEGARDATAEVRWRDMESRSLAQAADALGKIATMLGVPVQMLWEQIPGWTQQDVDRATELAKQQGGIDALLARIESNIQPGQQQPGRPVAA